jgi:hypothetical protein
MEDRRQLTKYHTVRYLNISGVKLDLAQFHLAEFERLEDELTPAPFNRFSNEPFVPAQANADGVLLQTAAAFDAFACAVAYHGELDDAHSASFDGRTWRDRLAEAAGEDLAEEIGAIRDSSNYRGLLVYRHLAAHRGVMGERIVGRQREEGGHEVMFILGDPLPSNAPDDSRSRDPTDPPAVRRVGGDLRFVSCGIRRSSGGDSKTTLTLFAKRGSDSWLGSYLAFQRSQVATLYNLHSWRLLIKAGCLG